MPEARRALSRPSSAIQAIETTRAGSRFRPRELNPSWKGDAASYKAIHLRLSSGPRPAACEVCGTCEGRMEWALRADAPAEVLLVSPEGWRYSTDTSHYANLCKSCHNLQDLGRDECRKGHPLGGENLYIQPSNGKRFCRACQKRRRRERTIRNTAAARAARFAQGA
jgi:hypothetical protein